MKKILLATLAVAALCGAALAQQAPGTAAPVLVTPAPVIPVLPSDPLELGKALLARAQEAKKCRYMFTQTSAADARVGIGTGEAAATFKYDPRLPLGTRWSLVNDSKRGKQVLKIMAKQDKLGFPNDVTAMLPEGAFTAENLAVTEARADVIVYSFTPKAILGETGQTEQQAKYLGQLIGRMEVDPAKGEISLISLTAPEAGVKMGIAKVKSATLTKMFALVAGKYPVVQRETQTTNASALFMSGEVTATTTNADITPICDPDEVAKIAAMEAAARAGAKKYD